MTVQRYRCKHAVEAMRWTDTDEDREAFADWFESHDCIFETRGPIVCLGADHNHAVPGEWIVWMDDEFVAMLDEQFVDTYELAELRGGER